LAMLAVAEHAYRWAALCTAAALIGMIAVLMMVEGIR